MYMTNKLRWCVLLLATAIVCTESHRLLSAESQLAGRKLVETDENALEHQRILAELEEVHQLRERMLQQAATYTSSGGAPAPAPMAASSPASPQSPPAESGYGPGAEEAPTTHN
ncbi:TPA: hypothetical protein ACH3X2_012766 [Trebouxia sp. C0005]